MDLENSKVGMQVWGMAKMCTKSVFLEQMLGRMWGGALLNHQHTAETTIVTLKQSLSLKIVKLGEEVMCPKSLIQRRVLHTWTQCMSHLGANDKKYTLILPTTKFSMWFSLMALLTDWMEVNPCQWYHQNWNTNKFQSDFCLNRNVTSRKLYGYECSLYGEKPTTCIWEQTSGHHCPCKALNTWTPGPSYQISSYFY